jgi:hypothetical protein
LDGRGGISALAAKNAQAIQPAKPITKQAYISVRSLTRHLLCLWQTQTHGDFYVPSRFITRTFPVRE